MQALKHDIHCRCNLSLSKKGKCTSCFKPLNPLSTECNKERLLTLINKPGFKICEIFEVN